MQSTFALAFLLLAGQLTEDGRYPDYQPGAETDPNQAAESFHSFSPKTPEDGTGPSAVEGGGETASSEAGAPGVETREAARPPASSRPIKPPELLAALSHVPESGKLAGELVALKDAVAYARTRDAQTEIITAYWELSAAVTDYYLSSREATEFDTLLRGIAQPGMAWEESRRALTARIQLAQRTVELAQQRLHKLMKNPAIQGLPLPADVPHTGAYETRYEENFAGRESSLSREQHELVPSLYRALSLQASQLAADERVRLAVSQQRSPQSDGTVLLKTHELVCLRRREFVQTVHEYNTQIARYTELASPSLVSTDRLVAMLIEKPAPSKLVREDSDVRTTGAEEPVERSGNSSSSSSQPRRFERDNRSSRRVVPGTPEGEHSIMVKPI